MRLWSIHPKYLDSKGLVALWRETLLAKNVIEGNTIGYKKHPQLLRFLKTNNPKLTINSYLATIYAESLNRGYNFNKEKIGDIDSSIKLNLNDKQRDYEFQHLQSKLKYRDLNKFKINSLINNIESNPLFNVVKGDIETWEKNIIK